MDRPKKRPKFTARQIEAFNKIDPGHQGLEELNFAWDEYAMAHDGALHESGKKLKRKLLELANAD